MDNESAVTGDIASIPAQAANPEAEALQAQTQTTVDAPAQAAPVTDPASVPSAIDARVQNITNLVQVLHQNPQLQGLLCTLLGVSVPNQTRVD